MYLSYADGNTSVEDVKMRDVILYFCMKFTTKGVVISVLQLKISQNTKTQIYTR